MRTSRIFLAGLLTTVVLVGPTSSVASAAPCRSLLGVCPPTTTTSTTTTSTTTPPPAPASSSAPSPAPDPAAAAARLLELANRSRADAGLGPLTMRGDIVAVAAEWSRSMAARQVLAHNDAYFTPDSRKRLDARSLGENVARNGSVDDAHARLMASPGHRANLLSSRYTMVGMAAVHDGAGSWWITQNFVEPMQAAAAPAPAPAAPAPAPAGTAPASAAPAAPAPTAALTSPRDATTTVPALVTTVAPETLAAGDQVPGDADAMTPDTEPTGDGHGGLAMPLGSAGMRGASPMIPAMPSPVLPAVLAALMVGAVAVATRRAASGRMGAGRRSPTAEAQVLGT